MKHKKYKIVSDVLSCEGSNNSLRVWKINDLSCYYEAKGRPADIFSAIEECLTVSEIITSLQLKSKIPSKKLKAQISRLLKEFKKNNLIESAD